jgi:tape measure domain-containing protein
MSDETLSLALKIRADLKQAYTEVSQLAKQIGAVSGAAGQLSRAAQQASAGMDSMAASAQKAATGYSKTRVGLSSISAQLAQFRNIALGMTGLSQLGSLVKLTDEYGQMASRIKMATESEEEYADVQARLLETANNTYRPLVEAQEVYIRSADALRSMGYNTQQAMDVVDSLSYLFVTNATSADRAQTAISMFSKSLATGKVSVLSWQSILAAVPTIVTDIAAATGKSTEEIRRLGAEGDLAVTDMSEGLRKSVEPNKKLAADMPVTVADAVTKVRNSLQVFLGELNSGTGATQVFVSALEGIGEGLGWLTDNLDLAAVKFGGFGEDIRRIPESFAFMTDAITGEMDSLFAGIDGTSGKIKETLADAFSNWPENVRAAIQVMTVELASFVDVVRSNTSDIRAALGDTGTAIARFIPGGTLLFGGDIKNADDVMAAREQSIQAIFDERDATLAQAEALKREREERRKAREERIKALRDAEAVLRNPTGKKDKEKQDPVERAWLSQQQSLVVALAEANQRLENARNGVNEADRRATDRLEIWLATNREAQKLTEAQIDGLRRQAIAVDAATRAYTDFTEAKRRAEEFRKAGEGLEIELLRLEGNSAEADRRELEARYAELRQKLDEEIERSDSDLAKGVRANIDAVIKLTLEKQSVDRVLTEIDNIRDRASRQTSIIDTNHEVGIMTDVEAQEALLAANLEQARQLRAMLPDLERMAHLPGEMGEQARAALIEINNQIKLLENTATLFEATLKNGVSEGLNKAISGLADGTMTLRDAIHELSTTIFQSLLKMYAENFVSALAKPDGLLGGLFQMGREGANGAGGILGALFGNGAGNAAGDTAVSGQQMAAATQQMAASSQLMTAAGTLQTAAAALSAASGAGAASGAAGAASGGGGGFLSSLFSIFGFAEGGYTGPGSKYQPAGLVHAGEFVTAAKRLREPGAREFLELLNRYGMRNAAHALGLPGFAEGGFVPAPPSVPSPMAVLAAHFNPVVNTAAGNTSVDNRINVVVVRDDEELVRFLGSAAGKKEIFKIVGRNQREFRQIMGI